MLRRVAAFGIDYVVLSLYIGALSVGFTLLPRDFVMRLFATPLSGQLTGIAILTLPVMLYFAVMECSRWRATVGKRILGLRVMDLRGNRISLGRSIARSGFKLVPWELAHTCLWRIEGWPMPEEPPTGLPLIGLITVWALVGANIVSVFITKRGQSLYDLASGTVITRG